jgi:hypothetical protein
MEVNSAFATVTIEELMGDQIRRNGESKTSNASQYNPYSYDETKTKPVGKEPPKRVNFLGGSDTYRPTKLDRILAIQNEISTAITELKKTKPEDLATTEEYSLSGEDGVDGWEAAAGTVQEVNRTTQQY